jgi:hypothetical protein
LGLYSGEQPPYQNVESVISEPVYIPMEVAKMNRKISKVGAKNKKNNY